MGLSFPGSFQGRCPPRLTEARGSGSGCFQRKVAASSHSILHPGAVRGRGEPAGPWVGRAFSMGLCLQGKRVPQLPQSAEPSCRSCSWVTPVELKCPRDAWRGGKMLAKDPTLVLQ